MLNSIKCPWYCNRLCGIIVLILFGVAFFVVGGFALGYGFEARSESDEQSDEKSSSRIAAKVGGFILVFLFGPGAMGFGALEARSFYHARRRGPVRRSPENVTLPMVTIQLLERAEPQLLPPAYLPAALPNTQTTVDVHPDPAPEWGVGSRPDLQPTGYPFTPHRPPSYPESQNPPHVVNVEKDRFIQLARDLRRQDFQQFGQFLAERGQEYSLPEIRQIFTETYRTGNKLASDNYGCSNWEELLFNFSDIFQVIQGSNPLTVRMKLPSTPSIADAQPVAPDSPPASTSDAKLNKKQRKRQKKQKLPAAAANSMPPDQQNVEKDAPEENPEPPEVMPVRPISTRLAMSFA